MRIIDSDSQTKHLQEWLFSGVDEEIYHLNVRSLFGTLPYEYLLYSPKISRRNVSMKQGATATTPDLTGDNSRRILLLNIGKSLGNPVVELATSNGTINPTEGTNKNDL